MVSVNDIKNVVNDKKFLNRLWFYVNGVKTVVYRLSLENSESIP